MHCGVRGCPDRRVSFERAPPAPTRLHAHAPNAHRCLAGVYIYQLIFASQGDVALRQDALVHRHSWFMPITRGDLAFKSTPQTVRSPAARSPPARGNASVARDKRAALHAMRAYA